MKSQRQWCLDMCIEHRVYSNAKGKTICMAPCHEGDVGNSSVCELCVYDEKYIQQCLKKRQSSEQISSLEQESARRKSDTSGGDPLFTKTYSGMSVTGAECTRRALKWHVYILMCF